MIKKLDKKESIHILKDNYIGYLGYVYLNRPFVVPITYYYDETQNTIICYSGEGHKIMAMRKNNAVSLNVSDVYSVNSWKSVLVHGTYEELIGSDGKAQLHAFSLGIKELIRNKLEGDPNYISDFSSKIYKGEIPIVFRIQIDDITGKKRNVF